MGSVIFVIALVSLFGLIVLLASTRAGGGLRGRLERVRGSESTNAETMLSHANDKIADGRPRRTFAFQLRVQVAQNPFKSMPPL